MLLEDYRKMWALMLNCPPLNVVSFLMQYDDEQSIIVFIDNLFIGTLHVKCFLHVSACWPSLGIILLLLAWLILLYIALCLHTIY
jgi:hypothetical protein